MKKSKESTISEFKIGEEYYHTNNNKIVTILDGILIKRYLSDSLRVRTAEGYEFNAWIQFLRPLTKLDKALK
jgi:hypothetical protein